MDFLRVVIQGGWVIKDQKEWIEIFKFLEIEDEINNNRQCYDFFERAS